MPPPPPGGGAPRPTIAELSRYFLWLGATGFGGPVVLAGEMERELVERRGWYTTDEYKEGFALAQMAPGPLAAQLAIYLGWVRGGIAGATAIGIAFILPSFLLVVAISALYVAYGELGWLQSAFYGAGAAVIAVMAHSGYRLAKKAFGADRWYWALGVASAVLTAWTETEFVLFFVLCGAVSALRSGAFPTKRTGLASLSPWLVTGLSGPQSLGTLGKITLFFAKSGLFVFGSGLAIIPFLHGGVVDDLRWLTERQFLDAIAVAMLTPGPVVITVAFIGYLVAGLAGAVAAATGVFVPVYLAVVLFAPWFRTLSRRSGVRAFIGGLTAAAVGGILGAVFVTGRRALVDPWTVGLALLAFFLITRRKKIPEPVVLALAGILGFALKKSHFA